MDNGVESQKVRALGEMLNNLVGQDVIVLGNVVDVSPLITYLHVL
jgi:hypothetical protein